MFSKSYVIILCFIAFMTLFQLSAGIVLLSRPNWMPHVSWELNINIGGKNQCAKK